MDNREEAGLGKEKADRMFQESVKKVIGVWICSVLILGEWIPAGFSDETTPVPHQEGGNTIPTVPVLPIEKISDPTQIIFTPLSRSEKAQVAQRFQDLASEIQASAPAGGDEDSRDRIIQSIFTRMEGAPAPRREAPSRPAQIDEHLQPSNVVRSETVQAPQTNRVEIPTPRFETDSAGPAPRIDQKPRLPNPISDVPVPPIAEPVRNDRQESQLPKTTPREEVSLLRESESRAVQVVEKEAEKNLQLLNLVYAGVEVSPPIKFEFGKEIGEFTRLIQGHYLGLREKFQAPDFRARTGELLELKKKGFFQVKDLVEEPKQVPFDENHLRMDSEGEQVVAVDSVDVDEKLAAIHYLLNPPKSLHPFLRYLFYDRLVTPEMTRWYWMTRQRIRDIYEKTKKAEKGKGAIRYKGKIVKAYLPRPDEIGGAYEYVVWVTKNAKQGASLAPQPPR